MARIRATVRRLAAALVISVFGVLNATAQQTGVGAGSQYASDLRAFREAFAESAHKNLVGFVIEGEPQPIVFKMRNALLVRAETEVSTSAPDVVRNAGSPLDRKVRRLADSYDYTTERRGALYLLRKKHTYASDIPDVTPEECWHAATEIDRAVESVSHSFVAHEQTDLLEGLVASLTPEQWKTLSSKGYLQTQTDLTDSQRQSMLSFVLHIYTIGGQGFRMVEWLLNPDAAPGFRRGKAPGTQADCVGGVITTHFGPKTRVDFVPIVDGPPVESEEDTGDQESVAEERDLGSAFASHVSSTLAQAVNALNRRRKDQKPTTAESAFTFHVDRALASKPVTLIGTEVESPVRVASAIAAVYGLRVQRAPSAPTIDNITWLAAPKMEQPSDLSLIAHKMFPAPLLSALRVDREDVLRAMPTYNQAENEEQVDLMRHKLELQLQIEEHRRLVIASCARRLSALLKRRLPPTDAMKSPGSPTNLPLAAADLYVQSLYSTYSMNSLIQQMDAVLYPPWTVSRFDQTCLICSPDLTNKESPKAAIGIGMYDTAKNACGIVIIKTRIPLPTNAPALAQ